MTGLNTGLSRLTLSRENEDTDAIFPVLKKADCNRKKKNNATRASEVLRVRNRYVSPFTTVVASVLAFLGGVVVSCVRVAGGFAV